MRWTAAMKEQLIYLGLKNQFIELRSDIFGSAWSCHQNVIVMFCFRSSGRSVNHSGHWTVLPNSDLQRAQHELQPANLWPENCDLQITRPSALYQCFIYGYLKLLYKATQKGKKFRNEDLRSHLRIKFRISHTESYALTHDLSHSLLLKN